MKIKLLRRLRKQAYANLTFIGVWSGYWFTVIDGKPYRSDLVSGFKYIVNDTGTFIQDAIISHCRKIRKKRNSYE